MNTNLTCILVYAKLTASENGKSGIYLQYDVEVQYPYLLVMMS